MTFPRFAVRFAIPLTLAASQVAIAAIVAWTFSCTAVAATAATAYKASLLHPPGFRGSISNGASTGHQVGYVIPEWTGSEPVQSRATLWTGSAASVVDLHPAGFSDSSARSVFGTHQVGWGYNTEKSMTHALLWNGSAESVVDLHPAEALSSYGTGISDESQVGVVFLPADNVELYHASLWRGTADSFVDLHPAPFDRSSATAVWGNTQVGYGQLEFAGYFDGTTHALLWQGTADSVLDLHPIGFERSAAYGVSSTSQVGIAGDAYLSTSHAMLWHGTAASAVDLHPTGYTNSFAAATAGSVQVGGVDLYAAAWNGSADSMIDLHSLLAELGENATYSAALGIADDGTIVGEANITVNGVSGQYAVLWTPIPEPASVQLLLFGMAAAGASVRRRRHPRRAAFIRWIASAFSVVAVALFVTTANASVLTFDQFTDPAKTTRIPNDLLANQSYGDNINDFSPATPIGGQYVNYGSAGGLTPNIKVAYRWYDTLQPTNPNPNNNGPGGVFGWNTQYGGLLYVIYSNPDTLDRKRWLSEVQFTPEPGYSVRINSLDYAGFQTAQPEQTLKILADANSASAQQLWSAGADGSVSFPASAATLSPAITGAPGQTVSILWGFSDRSGLDNICFSQIRAVPEPATVTIAALTLGWCLLVARRRTPATQ